MPTGPISGKTPVPLPPKTALDAAGRASFAAAMRADGQRLLREALANRPKA